MRVQTPPYILFCLQKGFVHAPNAGLYFLNSRQAPATLGDLVLARDK